MEAGADDARSAQLAFWVLWAGVFVIKLGIAAMLPLFVDEAFYWQEGQHLAAAYSDLPGLTAWLARLGVEVGGNHPLALRMPFLLLAALVPLLVVRITAREYGRRNGWYAGSFTLLLPLAGSLGLLALPDAPMALATLMCVDAGVRLLRRVDASSALELALGLAVGALSHYRFIAVIAVGFLALALLPDGRRVLKDVRTWTAIAFGASAWAPLIAWNFDNADAGLRFQLVDRHPWAFHGDGILFVAIQALMVTPLLFAALLHAGWRARLGALPSTRYFALLGLLIVAGFFLLGFFADTERVSFHWPLPGYLALLPLLPAALATWPRWLRIATAALAALGLVASLGYYAAASTPALRARAASNKWYPSNFAGWETLSEAVRGELARMPPGTRVIGDSFKVGAELGFALGNPDIGVLDHPLNRSHGRAPQLRLWGLEVEGREPGPALLVVAASEVKLKDLLAHYQRLCSQFGGLPPPRVVDIDHGHQRFLLFRLPAQATPTATCVTPVLAYIDQPVKGARVPPRFTVKGWAIKDGVGIERVQVLLDGNPVADAAYGRPNPGVQSTWASSTDPNHPNVGFEAVVDASGVAPGTHWLGLRLHGADGSVEDWQQQPVEIAGPR
ncbi:ArnT family glycosyltransferase [Lysobacter korlensis]|uniref:ArnT family glycosyltransferase n=1 Tax=Lysobacter korlensis TaxID=553636 RepID=A0ABV6RNW2_9GAMM